MNQKYNIILFVFVSLVIVIGIGLGIGRYSGSSEELAKLQAQVEDAKRFFTPLPPDIRTIFGTIKSVSGNAIVMDTTLTNPFEDIPKVRTVTVSSSTKIIKVQQKDPALYQKEMSEFQKVTARQNGIQATASLPAFPSPVVQLAGSLADLKEGMSVSVTAAENIKDKESFAAQEIQTNILSAAATSPRK